MTVAGKSGVILPIIAGMMAGWVIVPVVIWLFPTLPISIEGAPPEFLWVATDDMGQLALLTWHPPTFGQKVHCGDGPVDGIRDKARRQGKIIDLVLTRSVPTVSILTTTTDGLGPEEWTYVARCVKDGAWPLWVVHWGLFPSPDFGFLTMGVLWVGWIVMVVAVGGVARHRTIIQNRKVPIS